jgi:hypothetical protein
MPDLEKDPSLERRLRKYRQNLALEEKRYEQEYEDL